MRIPKELETTLGELKAADQRKISPAEHWQLLQQAHRFSQPYWYEHIKVHVLMLSYAIRCRAFSEIFVQIFFTIVSAPSSLLKLYPKDHPGTVTIE